VGQGVTLIVVLKGWIYVQVVKDDNASTVSKGGEFWLAEQLDILVGDENAVFIFIVTVYFQFVFCLFISLFIFV
jgi:hypothetical protein